MSRIGKKPVVVPAGVTVQVAGQTVTVKGPKGELRIKLRSLFSRGEAPAAEDAAEPPPGDPPR